MKQGVCVSVTAVQQVVDVVGMIRREGVQVLVGVGQLAVVAEVVQVLVILLYGPCGGEAGASAVVLPDGGKEAKEKGQGRTRNETGIRDVR